MKSVLKYLLKFVLIALAISSCVNKNTNNSKNETRVITDMNGRKVEIPAEINKVVAHRSGALRMICYLDVESKVIGVEENERRRNAPYLYACPELRKLPIIGSGNSIDAELVVILNPDVLICTYLNTGEADELQNKTGVPVVCLNNGDFNENKEAFYNSLRLLGTIFNKKDRPEYLINYIENSLNQIKKDCSKQPLTNSVYIGGIAYNGSHGITSTEPGYAPFRYTNAYNVAEELTGNSGSSLSKLNTIIIDKEQIIKWNPGKIFIDISGYARCKPNLVKESVFGRLVPAIRNDEVYFLLPHIWNNINYEHILINTYYIARVLHPDQYKDLNIEQKADEVYTAFLGKPIYNSMISVYGKGYEKTGEHE